MIAYKAMFENLDGTLESYSAVVGQGGIVYDEEKVNYPTIPNTALFCFKTELDAIRFIGGYAGSNVIYEVEIEPFENQKKKIMCSRFFINKRRIADFWNGTLEEEDIDSAPEGTILAKSVKLIRRVS